MKRIVICADGTWNRPEKDLEKDQPTNVLKMARAIQPVADDGTEQVVFYDWGLGSYHNGVSAGTLGEGINKNIQDCYRFIVQNYALGDELYFFGFSRGAFTVRSLSGFINNCGILKRSKAQMIPRAFEIYKSPKIRPDDELSIAFRKNHSVHLDPAGLPAEDRRNYTREGHAKVHFIGVWDTVGALGVPLSVLSFLNEKHMFHDNKIGPNIRYARHALAIDERRDDFKPTIWNQRPGVDIQQVWFVGCHSDVGGGLPPDKDRSVLSDIPLAWISDEAERAGLTVSSHLGSRLKGKATAGIHESYKGKWLLAGQYKRPMPRYLAVHSSVKERWDADPEYRPAKLKDRVKKHGWDNLVT